MLKPIPLSDCRERLNLLAVRFPIGVGSPRIVSQTFSGKEAFDAKDGLPSGRFSPANPSPADQSNIQLRRIVRQSAGQARLRLVKAPADAQASLIGAGQFSQI